MRISALKECNTACRNNLQQSPISAGTLVPRKVCLHLLNWIESDWRKKKWFKFKQVYLRRSLLLFYQQIKLIKCRVFIALFQYWSKRFTFNSVAIRILSATLQCPRHTHTFRRRSIDSIPSNYLITLRSTKQSRLKYLAQGHKHVGTSGARTHGLAHRSPALFH